MPIFHIANAISNHGISLERVIGKYNQKEGAPCHLLKEKDYKLIINIRLTDLKGNVLSHFLAWNGKVIIDHPNSSKENDTTDRTNSEKSRLAFTKLFPRHPFFCCGRSPMCINSVVIAKNAQKIILSS